MARMKKICTGEILAFVDQYMLENPDEKITLPKLGEFIRSQGRNVADYLIRRDKQAVQYIQEKRHGSLEVALQTVAVYQILDVDNFLDRNKSPVKLKTALMERDRYYKGIALSATKLFKQYDALRQELESEKQKSASLEKANADLKQRLKKGEERKTNETINKLKQIIKTYVYPEIANEILQKEGLIDFVGNRVNTSVFEKEKVDVNTDVLSKAESIAARLMKGFDE